MSTARVTEKVTKLVTELDFKLCGRYCARVLECNGVSVFYLCGIRASVCFRKTRISVTVGLPLGYRWVTVRGEPLERIVVI